MELIPRRVSLIVQTQDVILQGIQSGRWTGQLPGERKLATELQISRWTLRAALAALARGQVIRVGQGRACVINHSALSRPQRSRGVRGWHVGLVSPEPLWRLRPFVALWVDALRVWLQAQGGDLHLYHSASYFKRGGEAALAKLTAQSPHDCWSLLLCTHAVQRWFRDRGAPVVVVGHSYPDVQLPSVDLAYRAIGRHAAGTLLAQGHRRIACLSANTSLAGVIEASRGFSEAFAAPRYADAELIDCQHDGAPADICRALDRLLRRPRPPTALFVQQSNSLLTVLSHLAQIKRAVPRDLSVIVGEDEPYFRHIVPEFARYSTDADGFARRIGRFLRQAVEGRLPAGSQAQIMPAFIAGGTVARPRDH